MRLLNFQIFDVIITKKTDNSVFKKVFNLKLFVL